MALRMATMVLVLSLTLLFFACTLPAENTVPQSPQTAPSTGKQVQTIKITNPLPPVVKMPFTAVRWISRRFEWTVAPSNLPTNVEYRLLPNERWVATEESAKSAWLEFSREGKYHFEVRALNKSGQELAKDTNSFEVAEGEIVVGNNLYQHRGFDLTRGSVFVRYNSPTGTSIEGTGIIPTPNPSWAVNVVEGAQLVYEFEVLDRGRPLAEIGEKIIVVVKYDTEELELISSNFPGALAGRTSTTSEHGILLALFDGTTLNFNEGPRIQITFRYKTDNDGNPSISEIQRHHNALEYESFSDIHGFVFVGPKDAQLDWYDNSQKLIGQEILVELVKEALGRAFELPPIFTWATENQKAKTVDLPTVYLNSGKGTPSAATNNRIVYVAYIGSQEEIFTMEPDGSNQIRLTENNAHDYYPAWSPDHTKIAFCSLRDGNDEIYLMNADGSNLIRLTNNSAVDFYPTWSPDGKKIAFGSKRDGNSEIYVMNVDGSNQIRLTNNAADDFYPAWSPDGKKIAFVSTRDNNYEIYVMNFDGSNQIRLTNNSEEDMFPAWSRDGKKIAFLSKRDGRGDIYMMEPDGHNQTRITSLRSVQFQPAWSPDGTKIVFCSGGEIYIMNAGGSNQTRITNNSREDREPSW